MKFRKKIRMLVILQFGVLILVQAAFLETVSAYPVDNEEVEMSLETPKESTAVPEEMPESSQEPPPMATAEGDQPAEKISLRQGKADQSGGSNLFSGLSNFTLPGFPALSSFQPSGAKSNPNLILGTFSILTMPMPGMPEIASSLMQNPFLQNALKPPNFLSG